MSKTIEMKLKSGLVTIQMFPDKAPTHCKVMTALVNGGFYNGLKWHRVIDKFMAQTGCPFGTGQGGVNFKISSEISDLKHIRGTVSMARGEDINSASSQFFICLKPQTMLDSNYTIWGQVIDGMEHVDLIKKGNPKKNGAVEDPDIIGFMRLVDDG